MKAVHRDLAMLVVERRMVLNQAFVWPRERVLSELERLDSIISRLQEESDVGVRDFRSEDEGVWDAGAES